MHSVSKQLYLVLECIKLETSLAPECIMECLIQTIAYLAAYKWIHNMHRMSRMD